MKNLSPALLALFATNQPFEQFDLYTLTLTSGYVLRYANCPFDVVVGGNRFLCARSAGGIVIDETGDSGPRAVWTTGLDVGQWNFAVMPRDVDVIGDLPWLSAVRAGILNEGTVQVDRGIILAWPAVPVLTILEASLVGVVSKIFLGRVAGIDAGRTLCRISCNDARELLAIDIPRAHYERDCRYALFGAGCGLDQNAYKQVGTVTAVSATNELINTTVVAFPDMWFGLGSVKFTSGPNAGFTMMVRASIQQFGTVAMMEPMPFTIGIGDAIELLPGCDKTMATCQNKFANLVNYGGFPFIPAPETAI